MCTHPVYAPHREAKQSFLDVKYEQMLPSESPRGEATRAKIHCMTLDRRLPSPSSTMKVTACSLSEGSELVPFLRKASPRAASFGKTRVSFLRIPEVIESGCLMKECRFSEGSREIASVGVYSLSARKVRPSFRKPRGDTALSFRRK